MYMCIYHDFDTPTPRHPRCTTGLWEVTLSRPFPTQLRSGWLFKFRWSHLREKVSWAQANWQHNGRSLILPHLGGISTPLTGFCLSTSQHVSLNSYFVQRHHLWEMMSLNEIPVQIRVYPLIWYSSQYLDRGDEQQILEPGAKNLTSWLT